MNIDDRRHILGHFKRPYLSNASSAPLHVRTATVLCPQTLLYASLLTDIMGD